MDPDGQLIQATLDGNSAAFGELVRRYQDRLLSTLTHVVGSVEDAQDITQETFVQAFVRLDSFRGASAFYTWLYRIAFNQAVTLRRRTRPSESLDAARELRGDMLADGREGPDGRLVRGERALQVQAALRALSQEHRTILVLREVEGCSYEMIAEMLNLPVGTVRSRLARARLQLRNELKDVLQEEVG